MNRSPVPGAGPAVLPLIPILLILWLAGTAIRIPLLVVPPVVPLMHDDLHMSETQVGLLIGLPLIMFALAAVPGSLLIARFGVLRIATVGLATTALAAAARSAANDVWTLYGATALMGFGVAIVQPALPTLARIWTPTRIWLASAVYTNGMLIGATSHWAPSEVMGLRIFGWQWIMIWLGAPGLIVALLFVTVKEPPRLAPTADAPQPRVGLLERILRGGVETEILQPVQRQPGPQSADRRAELTPLRRRALQQRYFVFGEEDEVAVRVRMRSEIAFFCCRAEASERFQSSLVIVLKTAPLFRAGEEPTAEAGRSSGEGVLHASLMRHGLVRVGQRQSGIAPRPRDSPQAPVPRCFASPSGRWTR